MPIITLTTDLGLKDYYVAAVKGAILSRSPHVMIIDISHQVTKFDISQGAFIIKNVYRDFPKGTIHIIGVLPDKTNGSGHIAVLYDNHYFIGADNGIFSMIFEHDPEAIMELYPLGEKVSYTFSVKDIFVAAACHLANGGKLDDLGRQKAGVLYRPGFNPVITENALRGTVIYIDDFGNAKINIDEKLFFTAAKGREFSISLRTGRHEVKNLCKNYTEVPPGEILALFSDTGLLEIAINTGSACDLLGIRLNDIIVVDFF